MKKIVLIMMFALASTFTTKAQTDICGCTTVTTHLDYLYYAGVDPCGNDCYIDVFYTLVTCGAESGIGFSYALFTIPYSPPCVTPFFNSTNLTAWYRLAQQAVLDLYPTTNGGIMDWVYPAGCYSDARVDWPNVTCYTFYAEGPNKGKISSTNQLGPNTLELLPCDGQNCCTFKYTYSTTTGLYSFVSQSGDLPCTTDLTAMTDTLRCLDINGVLQTYLGTITSHDACHSYCDPSFNLMIRTDRPNNKLNNNIDKISPAVNYLDGNVFKPFPNPLDFNLAPTLAHDIITFSDTKEIEKIVIFDVTGKKIMEQSAFDNNTLNISKLTEGMYNVRVYFNNTGIRTIKIMKQ